jgi:hypothetical protein
VFLASNRAWLFSRQPPAQTVLIPDQNHARQLTFLAIFLALPFEIAFVALGGRNFMHYYMTILPVFAAADAYLIERLTRPIFSRQKIRRVEMAALIALAVLGVVWIAVAYQVEKPNYGVRVNLSRPLYGPLPQSDIEKYILGHTGSDDAVLVWQNNKRLNLLTDRRNPSRYLFPLHLFQPKSGPVSRFDQFLQDLQNDPPALILAPKTPDPSLPFINAADDQLCPGCIPAAVDGLKRFKAFVEANYTLVPGDDFFLIYARNH